METDIYPEQELLWKRLSLDAHIFWRRTYKGTGQEESVQLSEGYEADLRQEWNRMEVGSCN